MPETTQPKRHARLLERAMRILSMRDHSEAELRRKLLQSAEQAARLAQQPAEPPTEDEISAVIDWCAQHNWLDDERFVERYIASRSRKGYGPQRIRMELMQKGLEATLIDDALAISDSDWQSLAFSAAERKFGLPLPTEWKEKARVQRYLMTKGFFMADIRAVFEHFND